MSDDVAAAASGRLDRCGVSQITTLGWTLGEDVAAYAAAGWGGLGVWLQKLEQERLKTFRFPPTEILDPAIVDAAAATIRDADLRVTHLVCGCLFTDPDEARRRLRIEHALFAVDTAQRLDAACLVVIPGGLHGQPYAKAFALAEAGLAEILERSDPNVRLAIEPVRDVDFAHTLAQALDMADAVADPRVGVYLDTFHLWNEPGLRDQIERASGRILGVHIADANAASASAPRLVPGDGVIPLAEFLKAVEHTGYSGTYDIELLGEAIWAEEPSRLLKRCADRLGRLVADAIDPTRAPS